MLVDYHNHNYLCKHAEGTLEEYVRHAIKIGLNEIGLSDHTPMPDNWDHKVRMKEEQFWSEYKPTVLALQEKYRDRICSLYWFDESNKIWIDMKDTTDTAVKLLKKSDKIEATLTHFSIYGVFPSAPLPSSSLDNIVVFLRQKIKQPIL